MRVVILFLLFISSFSFSQSTQKHFNSFYISGDFGVVNDSDSDFQIADFKDHLTIGALFYDYWMIGVTTENSRKDFRVDGLEPIPDSLLISETQVLARYYTKYDCYLQIKLPISSQVSDVSILDQVRLGVGYQVMVYNDLFLDTNYDLYLSSNKHDFRKGKLKLGVGLKF